MDVLDLWENILRYGYHNQIVYPPFRSFSVLFKSKCQVFMVDIMDHPCIMTASVET